METNTERNTLFRAKSLDRISSPEDLTDYVRVTNPGVWIILIAIVILLAGMLVWSGLGTIETTDDALCISSDGRTVCYVSSELSDIVHVGQKITLADGTVCRVTEISDDALSADEVLTDYQQYLADFADGEWILALTTDHVSDGDAFTAARITVDSVRPMEFIFS